MTKFQRGKLNLPPVKEYINKIVSEYGLTRKQAKDQYNWLKSQEIWLNDTYQVNIDYNPSHGFPFKVVHLSIKRLDKSACRDWRHFQAIKSELLGPHVEAIEIFPDENRKVDCSNQYHLWAFPSKRIPVGWMTRAVSEESKNGYVQRPYECSDWM